MAFSSTLTPTPAAGKGIRYTWFTQLLENTNVLRQYEPDFESITLAAGDTNNQALGSTTRVIRVTGNAAGTSAWTGWAGGSAGRVVRVLNISSFDVTIKPANASSLAANRFACPGNANVVLNSGDGVEAWYDVTSSLWRVMGT